MAFKIAYNAGHILATPGKRIPAALDAKQTREWVLNDRIARYFAEEMACYEDVELRRMDDPNGIKPIDIDVRVAEANKWEADFYLSIHHNAAGVIFNGGGIVVFIDQMGGMSEAYAENIYAHLISATGLKGNRSDHLVSSDEQKLYECRATNMPAVLVEYGFMDSRVDAPIILTEEFAKKSGIATAKAVAEIAGLKRKTGFQDVAPNAWYAKSVEWAVENGISNGTDEHHFSPDAECTRAQAVTFLWRMAGQPEPKCIAAQFVDVTPVSFYAKAVSWAVESGITNGTDATHFSPDAPCTRGQIVTFLYRMAGKPITDAQNDTFVDVDKDDYFFNPVCWAVAEGVTNGVDDDEFAPDDKCTRAQMVTFMYRARNAIT